MSVFDQRIELNTLYHRLDSEIKPLKDKLAQSDADTAREIVLVVKKQLEDTLAKVEAKNKLVEDD